MNDFEYADYLQIAEHGINMDAPTFMPAGSMIVVEQLGWEVETQRVFSREN